MKFKHIRSGKSRHVKEVFLTEALDHVSGRDIAAENMALPKDSVIDVRTVASLAAAGVDRVPVYDEPKISILSIGNELIAPGVPAKPGKVHDASIPMLLAALESMRLRPVFVRRLVDEPKTLRRLLPFALNQSDLLVLMAKEAWEDEPFLPALLEGMNAPVVPISGESDGAAPHFTEDRNAKLVFYLPYEANLVFKAFYQYIRPAIQFFMGYPTPAPLKK